MLGLPLFGDAALEALPQSNEAAELAHLDAVAHCIVISGFAYYQDEQAMAYSFKLREAARKIYGKNRELNGDLPPHVLEHIRLAGEAGSRAMDAAEYREDTNAELNDRIDKWTAELAKPAKKHGGKKAKRKADDDEFEDEPGDADENRRILQEWLGIALEERARRDRTPNFDHLADIEQRAREKFGEEGLALMQRYVGQAMAYGDDRWNADDEVLVNGKCLPCTYEAMHTLRQGDAAAAERFVNVLAKARADQHAGYPDGVTVTFAPRGERDAWTTEKCLAFIEAIPGGIAINGTALDLGEYTIEHHEFPVEYALTPERTKAWWARHFANAKAAAVTDHEQALLDSMDFARIDVPIVAVHHGGMWYILDGRKRVASRFYNGLERVPAIWIVPKPKPQRLHAAHQAQLLDYDNGGPDFEDEDLDCEGEAD